MHRRDRVARQFRVMLVAVVASLLGLTLTAAAPASALVGSVDAAQPDTRQGARLVTMVQQSSSRFMDAHEIASKDFNVVTRPQQGNATQQWLLSHKGNGQYTIMQASSGRFLDAHEIPSKDFRVVTRPQQNDATQLWRLIPQGAGFVVQQVSSGRLLDAHETASKDFQVVTRQFQGNTTQQWRIADS